MKAILYHCGNNLFLSGHAYGGEFVDNNDGTVTDTDTGLMWQQEGHRIQMNWESAKQYCQTLKFAGYNDWRLPNEKEIKSLKDYFWNETLNYLKIFPDTKKYFYWTSTEMPFTGPCDPPGYAMCEAFIKSNEIISLDNCKLKKYFVRAVRDSR